MQTLDRPIVIVGSGRSGSTAFHRTLAAFPGVMSMTPILNWAPGCPQFNQLIVTARSLPLIGPYLWVVSGRAEPYQYWNSLTPAFADPCRDLQAFDLTRRSRTRVRKALAKLPTRNRPRLLIKITGVPRIGLLREVLPNARFIHLVRDPRGVVNSLLHVKWWKGWQGPEALRGVRFSSEHWKLWERYDRSFVALAAIEWNLLMELMERASAGLPEEQFMELRYEDMCADPVSHLKDVIAFCGLRWPRRVDRILACHPLRSRNDRWRHDLTPVQQEIATELTAPYRARYGYVP